MGATKYEIHEVSTINLSMVTRALAHPARLKIVELLHEFETIRNIDLIHDLELSKSTLNVHLQKLKDADLIHFTFSPNCYLIRLNSKNLYGLIDFLLKISR